MTDATAYRAATQTPVEPPILRWTCPSCRASARSRKHEVLWGYRHAHAEFHKDEAINLHPVDDR